MIPKLFASKPHRLVFAEFSSFFSCLFSFCFLSVWQLTDLAHLKLLKIKTIATSNFRHQGKN